MVEAMTSGQTPVVFPGPAKAGKNLEIFDEFKETEIGPIPVDWEVVRLGELGMQFFSGGTPSTKKAEFWDGDIPWTTSAYIADDLYLNRGARYITAQGLEHSSAKLVPQGNLQLVLVSG